jgi:hypothetical protein
MRVQLTSTTAVAALLALSGSAQAGKVIVGDIYGSYDAQCGSNIDCSLGTGLPVTVIGTDGSSPPTYGEYDTPSLFIVNKGTKPFTGLTLTATGYQGINTGITQSITLPNVPGGSILDVVWAMGYAYQNPGSLFNYDYDDSYFATTYNPTICVAGSSFCAVIGNFDLKLTGTLNSGPISSSFSPDNTQDGGNQQGTFVGFEGVNQQGYSESIYDNHSGSTPGVLAYIYTGTHGNQTIPEPSTWAMMAVGFAGLGSLALARRRRKPAAVAV